MMDIWDWIDYLAKGLKKAANESQQNYQQVHAYINGHDQETLDEVKRIRKEPGPPGQTWQPYVGDDGNWHLKLIISGGEA